MSPASGVLFRDYLRSLRVALRRWADLYELAKIGRARSQPLSAPLVRIASRPLRPGGLMLMAGFHGEEPAGPLALLHFIHHILGRADALRVPLVVYPVVNPFGFDRGLRTTVDGQFTNAGFAHDEDPIGPEATLLRADMERARSAVFLDLHEDDHETRSYLYAFGDPTLARQLTDAAGSFLPLADGPLIHSPQLRAAFGQIRDFHDGSAEDFMGHQPSIHASFASETPTSAALPVRLSLHLALIDRCLDAVAALRQKTAKK